MNHLEKAFMSPDETPMFKSSYGSIIYYPSKEQVQILRDELFNQIRACNIWIKENEKIPDVVTDIFAEKK